MSAPKIIVQIVITGTQIFGKALYAGVQQAVKNAKATPAALGSDVAGVGNAKSGSPTDQLTREHRLTLDEAHLILNTQREDSMEQILERYHHSFKINSPPEAAPANPDAPPSRSRKTLQKHHSHYLQSKVVRARERIEAELKLQEVPPPEPPSESTPPPSS